VGNTQNKSGRDSNSMSHPRTKVKGTKGWRVQSEEPEVTATSCHVLEQGPDGTATSCESQNKSRRDGNNVSHPRKTHVRGNGIVSADSRTRTATHRKHSPPEHHSINEGELSVDRGLGQQKHNVEGPTVTVPSTLGLPPLDRRGYQPCGRPDGVG
jgi:hypothetical protein